jgi:hypothetical protein
MAAAKAHKPLMDAADFSRLRKLLALTTSDADGEALSAIRMANAILTRTKVHWFDVMDAAERVTEEQQPAPPRKSRVAEEIDEAFDLVLATSQGAFREFILDLLEQWQDAGSLSPKQRAALLKAARRARGPDTT